MITYHKFTSRIFLIPLPKKNMSLVLPPLTDTPLVGWFCTQLQTGFIMSGKVIEFKRKKTAESDSALRDLPATEPATFKHFHLLIMSNQLDLADMVLAHLLGVEKAIAHSAARYYARAFASNPQHVEKTMSIREVIDEGVTNNGILLMYESFGLDGAQAVCAIEHIINANKAAN